MNGDGTTPAPGSLEETALNVLLDLVRNSASPEIAQAQAIMLRRLALEGDVVGSRIPAPLNITEVGGYINLLGELKQPEMRAQMLAGALGVAGPNPPLGWLPTTPAIGWVTLPNDRPPGPGQATIPLSFTIRSDFAPAIQLVLKGLHDQGCALPLVAPQPALPSPMAPAVTDVLPLIGRSLTLAVGAGLQDSEADALAVARVGADPYQVVARQLSTGPIGVAPGPWEALTCTALSCTPVPPTGLGRSYVPLAPVLATAGFYPTSPGHTPTSLNDAEWARFVNTTGLVAGTTTLADELTHLYNQADLASSGLVGRLYDVWNGTTFASS